MSGLRRGFSPGDIIHNIKSAKNLLYANIQSGKLIKGYEPCAVIGTGGYICYPVLKKAANMGIPTFVLEPNACPGLSVRMLSTIVDKIFITYAGLENRYKQPERVVYTGTPLRSEFLVTENDPCFCNKKEKPLVVSYWGSVGAARMNEKILGFIKLNAKEHKFNHIHATGMSGSAEELKSRLAAMGVSVTESPVTDVREYIDDMPSVMKAADIVISRAGASTIAELAALGKPAVLIPSPNVTENHQEENARHMQEAGGAVIIHESECTGDMLYRTVLSLINDEDKLKRMSNAQKSLSVPNAAARVVEIVLEYCSSKGRAE
jgi:UDP-N-acetylglucosamine--N-acetylmuramyl-(pentapeptide) pyrophosphoryl-undecaprenol N-acetylglucosamine transferase